MTGKTLEQLMAAKLRGECVFRGISMSRSKADLAIRLEEAIWITGQDPTNACFYSVQSLDVTLMDNTVEQRFATATLVDTGAPQPTWSASVGSSVVSTEQQTLADPQSGQSGLQSTMRQGESGSMLGANLFETALSMLKITLPTSNDNNSFEARLMALETSMTRFFAESRQKHTHPPAATQRHSPVVSK
ncbi:hypothetical protein QTP88_018936 [Uroleucon formosanum]